MFPRSRLRDYLKCSRLIRWSLQPHWPLTNERTLNIQEGCLLMHYLGGFTGSGMLMCDGENIARVSYDFDSFRRPSTEIVGNGEIAFAVSALKDVFGRDVQIQTDDGRLLNLKFSEKTMD